MQVAYIAGPYRGKSHEEIHQHIEAARDIARLYWLSGMPTICPHTNTAWMDGDDTSDIFLKGDLEILRRCDVIVMLPGWEASVGATAEHALAKELGKEIHYV